MRRVEFDQGSDEWIAWRLGRVTATDASAIMGTNPFKTIHELWEEKLGISKPKPSNSRMQRGQELEPVARQLFIEETFITVSPVVIEHDIDWWHGASLDGIDDTGKIIVEIKCPSNSTHAAALEGTIPSYYRTQIQHQFHTSGAELCYYVSYNPDMQRKLAILEILPDYEFIQEMVLAERTFFEVNMCTYTPPDPPWKFKASA